MRKRALLALLATLAGAGQATALAQAPGASQQKTVTGRVTSEQGEPMGSVSVVIKGTNQGTMTRVDGNYSIRVNVGQVLIFRLIGNAAEERTVGTDNVINVTLRRVATQLDAMVVTALGQTAQVRTLGTAQQTVDGAAISEAQRQNFVNALQGRVAGIEVTSSSGVPGASSAITIRGVSSISSSNQPLMIVDGLPLDNKTMNTGVLASDRPGSVTAFSNRGVDFTNRAADINPDDIESLTVLKGPEASALYGIDAANGAIVITTKRGRSGAGGFEYSSSFRMDKVREAPEMQGLYSLSAVGGDFFYFGTPYAPGATFYDNVDGFFRDAITQRHNLSFSGGAPDRNLTYRVAMSGDKQEGVVPNSDYQRINLTGSTASQVSRWLRADLSMQYAMAENNQTFKGSNGPLLGLLLWPRTDDAKDWLTPSGNRRRLTNLAAASEVDNPYFNVEKNKINSKNSRLISNLGLILTPFSWFSVKSNIGIDGYTNENLLLRHPESAYGNSNNGILDQATDVVRNLNAQTLVNFEPFTLGRGFSINGLLGNQISDFKSTTQAIQGLDFLDPNFVSANNTNSRTNFTTLSQRRLMSLFGSATLNYNDYLYLTGTLRNDWTSTIPTERNSFMYPGISGSFVISDAFPSMKKFLTARLRGGYAEVGKDARPYAFRPSLEFKTTSYGGYGYGFTGPNLALKPEFARSYEAGTELGFLKDRVGLDITWYRKQTKDQIVNDIRGSYATGYILFNLNGAVTRNEGWEVTLRGTPMENRVLTWDLQANFDRSRGRVLELPNALPESYVSDTWLYGNVRNGTQPGLSTRSLTGTFYLRNNTGELLIDPTTGLPIRSASFIDRGYDRQPQFLVGLTNSFRHRNWSLNVLVDIRRGGDVLNATEHYLTTRGLSKRTLDREKPRVIAGVLRDGKENSATPTQNTIVVIPAVQTQFYTGMSEELFIEQDINWLRLRDVTLRYQFKRGFLNSRDASVFLTGTDLFLWTNYSGLDPIVNGNTAAVGGSGAAGIDFGNFPLPRGFTFGFKVTY